MKHSPAVMGAAAVAALLLCGAAGCRRDPLDRAMRALAAGNPVLAESLLVSAADSHPDDPSVQANLALARMKLGQVDAALSGFRQAADLLPGDPRPLEFMAAMAAEESRWRMSQELLLEAARRDPRSPRILTALASTELKTSGPQAAVARLQQALAGAPNYSPALFNMALIQQESLANPGEAARLFERFIAVSRDEERLAIARRALRDLRAASPVPPASTTPDSSPAARAGARSARSGIAFYNEGVRHHTAGELEEAIEDYSKAVEANPAMANAHYNLGLVYNARRNPDAARQAFQRALDIQPALSDARYMLACLLRDQKQPRAAIDQLETLVARNPDHAQAQHALGLLYKDDPASVVQARRAFQKYLELAPTGTHAGAARNWLKYHN